MNASSDPCEDFHGFACGGWIDQNEIPPDQSTWGTLDQMKRRNDEKLAEEFRNIDVSGFEETSAI